MTAPGKPARPAVSAARPPGWQGVVALGILTITAYGSWFYGFGVLIDPITADVGWSTTTLGLTYGAAQVITGLGSFVGGRLLDRHGGIGPFGLQAIAGGGFMLASTWADSAGVFGVLYAVGAGIVGATGFYHVTTAAAARLRADRPDRAIAVLTIIGAFCSPIYLPLTAWLVTIWHWRTVARLLAVLAIAGALLAVVVTRSGARSTISGPSPSPLGATAEALRRPTARRMLIVYFAAGIAYASVLVYQVPILTGAGIGLATAGMIGGLRGFCQVFGRIGLSGLVERYGSRSLLRTAYGVSAGGIAFLLVGTVPAGIAFALLAGAALGSTSPLQAMYARTQFGEADLGLLMGLQGAAVGLAGGLGPLVGGAMRDLTGSWTPAVLVAVASLAFGAWFLGREPARS